MKFYKWIILTMGAVLVVAFNNCSGVGFSSDSDSSNGKLDTPTNPPGTPDPGTPPGTPVPPPPDPRIPQIVKNCNDAIAAGTIKTMDQTIDFNDTKIESGRTQVCQFGQGDNLSEVDGVMRAHYDQNRPLNLPANAVLCDVQMTTAKQGFKYDDIFFLTFNNLILGSDNLSAIRAKLQLGASAQLANGKLVPLYKWDWLSIRNAPFKNVADDYCAGADQGGGSCAWPVTEQSGNIVFQFNPELLVAIGLQVPANQQSFGFIMTGDNDPNVDCYHEDLQFAMHVKYYLQ